MTRNYFWVVAGIPAITCLFLATLFVAACNKKPAGNTEAGTLADQARNWFQTTLVANEKSRMAQPFSQLPSDDPARRFARLRGLNNLLNWGRAREYKENGSRYVLVPVEESRKPFGNSDFEAARSLAFYMDPAGTLHLSIIELLSEKGRSLGANPEALAQAAFVNKQFGTARTFPGASVSAVFYNENYQQESAFRFRNGAWEKTKLNLVNQNGTPRNRTVPLMLGRTTCQTCQTWYLIGIWYDLHTGEVLDYEILDQWDECVETGAPPAGYGDGLNPPDSEEDCQEKMQQFSGSSASESAGVDIGETGPTTRTRTYHWVIFKQDFGLWRFISHEKGVHVKTNDPLHPWKWQSLTHESVSREGVVLFGSVECTVNTAESYLAIYTAGMQLHFSISAAAICKGSPISGVANYSASHIWHVDAVS